MPLSKARLCHDSEQEGGLPLSKSRLYSQNLFDIGKQKPQNQGGKKQKMSNRRSLGDALTPDKVAFIRSDKTSGGPSAKKPGEVVEKAIDLGTPTNNLAQHGAPPRRPRTRGRATPNDKTQATDILDQMLVPVTIRLKHRTAQALKRAALEQKLNHIKPDQVQEIGEEAFSAWLAKSGYLD